MQVTLELDRRTTAAPEWAEGATVRVEIGPAEGPASAKRDVEEFTLEPGARVYALRHPARDLLAPGRYQVRAQVLAKGARSPLTLSTVVTVPPATRCWAMPPRRRGAARAPAVSSCRPPIRASAAPSAWSSKRRSSPPDATVAARLLNRAGQPMAVPVTLSERLDESLQLRVASPRSHWRRSAPGEYIVEVTATGGGNTSNVSYGFRVIP